MKQLFFILLVFSGAFFVSCESDGEDEPLLAPDERIQGKWVISSSEILGQTVPGDGSYLEFHSCETNCGGIDYIASDETSGEFSYTLNDNGTLITIVDDSPDGGAYNGEWDILEFSNSKIVITAETFLGPLRMEMNKE